MQDIDMTCSWQSFVSCRHDFLRHEIFGGASCY